MLVLYSQELEKKTKRVNKMESERDDLGREVEVLKLQTTQQVI